MAAPTAPAARSSQLQARIVARLRQPLRALGAPLASLVFAFVVGALVILVTHGDPIRAYADLLCGGFAIGCSGQAVPGFQLNLTVLNMTPLLLTAVAVAIAFRAGLFNIGAEGQYLSGIIASTAVGVAFKSLPGVILLPLVLLAGALAGAVCAGIAGVLKALTGAHEVVTTIMLNAVALLLTHYLVGVDKGGHGPLRLNGSGTDVSAPIGLNARLPRLVPQSGTFFGLPGSVYTVHAGILIALAMVIVYWFIIKRTSLGYQIGAVGQSQRASRYAGISAKRVIIVTMLLSGAFAGLAGAIQISGLSYQLVGGAYDVDTTGFDGLTVALLAQNSPIGIVLAALLFGGLNAAGSIMQSDAGISSYIVAVLQGLVLLSIAANFLRTLSLRLPALSQRAPSATDIPPEPPAAVVEEGQATVLDTSKTSVGETGQ
jgi:simple sugar transport system permease protein